MRDLQPCSQCHRHVATDERDCPFCGAVVTSEPVRSVPGGKLNRAAIFASALAGATALGCGPTQTNAAEPPPPPPPVEVADAGRFAEPPPPPDNVADASTPPLDKVADASTPVATPDAAAPIVTAVDAAPARNVVPPHRIIPNKPYGAPPARKRLV